MNGKLRQQVVDLRTIERLSYSAIVKKLGVPKSTLSYWLRDFPLTKEEILELRRKNWKNNEAKIELFRATMREKREEKAQRVYWREREKMKYLSKMTLFVAGLMIYLGEGEKTTTSRIGLVNTDPRIVKFFVRWMVEFLKVPRASIKAQLQLYPNMDIETEKEFWQKELQFEKSQFYKPFIHKLSPSSFSYKGSHRHGTCGVYFGSAENKTRLMMAIKAFLDQTLST